MNNCPACPAVSSLFSWPSAPLSTSPCQIVLLYTWPSQAQRPPFTYYIFIHSHSYNLESDNRHKPPLLAQLCCGGSCQISNFVFSLIGDVHNNLSITPSSAYLLVHLSFCLCLSVCSISINSRYLLICLFISVPNLDLYNRRVNL